MEDIFDVDGIIYSVFHILQVMKYILLERNAKRWAGRQKANGVAAEDQVYLNI